MMHPVTACVLGFIFGANGGLIAGWLGWFFSMELLMSIILLDYVLDNTEEKNNSKLPTNKLVGF